MSWSVNMIGKPDQIVAEVERESQRLTGASKAEFDSVKPAMLALVEANFVSDEYAGKGGVSPTLQLTANGHGTFIDGRPQYGNCSITLEQLHTKILG